MGEGEIVKGGEKIKLLKEKENMDRNPQNRRTA